MKYNLISGEEAILVILCSLETRDGKYLASIRKIMMIYLKDKAIAHLLAHKGVQLSHLESQLIEILSHELSCAHCKLLSGFRLVEIWA